MKIKRLVVGMLGTNCYLLWDERTREGVAVDPGDDGAYITEQILKESIKLKAILLTHGHFDHVLALLEVKTNFPQARVYLNRKDGFLLQQAQSSGEYWTKVKVDMVPQAEKGLEEGQIIEIGEMKIKVLATPGHTPGSVCLWLEEERVLLSGDTLFSQGVGRVDFSYSSRVDLEASLRRLGDLTTQTRVLPGHGEETTIGREREFLELGGSFGHE